MSLMEALGGIEKMRSTTFHATAVAMSLATVPDGTLYDVNETWIQ
jgi:hypothetical protein